LEEALGGGSVVLQDATSRRTGWATTATRNFVTTTAAFHSLHGCFQKHNSPNFTQFHIHSFFFFYFSFKRKRASSNNENVIRGEREIVWPDNYCIPQALEHVSVLSAKPSHVTSFQKGEKKITISPRMFMRIVLFLERKPV
jgi:hypothetical protein